MNENTKKSPAASASPASSATSAASDSAAAPVGTVATIATTPARRRRYFLIGTAAVAVLAIGFGAAIFVNTRDTPVVDAGPARVDVADVDGYGDVLVDGEGRTLYLFEPDDAAVVTCTGGCADKWPPLVATSDEPEIGEGIDASLVSTVKDQDGASVVTFDGWPLYRYTSDQLGEITGTDKDQNGGVWWALTPAGERVQNR